MNTLRQSAINEQTRTVNELTRLQEAIGKLPENHVFNMIHRCNCILGFAAKKVYRLRPGDCFDAAKHMELFNFGFYADEVPFIGLNDSYRPHLVGGEDFHKLTRDEAIMMLEAVKICVKEGI